jgi:Domain of unknown function (DUF5666)
MRTIRRVPRAALAAGVLMFTGSGTLAEDRSGGAPAPSRTAGSPSSTGNADETRGRGALGAATTEQQSRPASGPASKSKTQGGATETQEPGMGMESANASGATREGPLTGRVAKIDRSRNTIEVGGKTLKIDSTTELTKDGTRAGFQDIKEGDQVRASYAGSGKPLHAQRLEVTSSSSDKDTSKSTGSTRGSDTGTGSTGSSPGTAK